MSESNQRAQINLYSSNNIRFDELKKIQSFMVENYSYKCKFLTFKPASKKTDTPADTGVLIVKKYMPDKINEPIEKELNDSLFNNSLSQKTQYDELVKNQMLPLLSNTVNVVERVLECALKSKKEFQYFDVLKHDVEGNTYTHATSSLYIGKDGYPVEMQWSKNSKPIGRKVAFTLNKGDMYIIGTNLECGSIYDVIERSGDLIKAKKPKTSTAGEKKSADKDAKELAKKEKIIASIKKKNDARKDGGYLCMKNINTAWSIEELKEILKTIPAIVKANKTQHKADKAAAKELAKKEKAAAKELAKKEKAAAKELAKKEKAAAKELAKKEKAASKKNKSPVKKADKKDMIYMPYNSTHTYSLATPGAVLPPVPTDLTQHAYDSEKTASINSDPLSDDDLDELVDQTDPDELLNSLYDDNVLSKVSETDEQIQTVHNDSDSETDDDAEEIESDEINAVKELTEETYENTTPKTSYSESKFKMVDSFDVTLALTTIPKEITLCDENGSRTEPRKVYLLLNKTIKHLSIGGDHIIGNKIFGFELDYPIFNVFTR
tara:strand:- start:2483 stop:4132 length:1650 start_codon:yes stop_codon:yes gene_type:complete